MTRRTAVGFLLFLAISGSLFAQRAVDSASRYFRVICLVHLKDAGQGGHGIVPEFADEGMAVAQAAQEAAVVAASKGNPGAAPEPRSAVANPAEQSQKPTLAAASSRPGILAWSMLESDDGTMAIVQLVAADRRAFDSIFADKRPEIRVFEIGRDKPEAIQSELRKFRKDFDLQKFQVRAQ
jgi:hypothetical protein